MIPSRKLCFPLRQVLLFQIVVLWIQELSSNRYSFAQAQKPTQSASSLGSGGFNYEIEKRVHERVTELMNVPVRMLGLVEKFAQTDVFDPPVLRPHQRDEFFRFLWTVWAEFKVDLYYGQEDGLFLGIVKGSGTYQEGRGTNGYRLEETTDSIASYHQDLYLKRLYYNECLDRETGRAQNCSLQVGEDFIQCIDDCHPSVPCPTRKSMLALTKSSAHGIKTKIIANETTIYCPAYEIRQVPSAETEHATMGYIPRYYYCLNDAGQFVENDPPNTVASPALMKNGVCTHTDGKTLVDGKTSSRRTYAVAHEKNYVFLRDYDNRTADATAIALYSADPDTISDDQKTDQIFVGGYHSRRYEPRLRPWYIGTREVQNAFWTSPYPFATASDIGISYGKPLYYTDPSTGRKVFRGVLCVDYDLNEISEFLNNVFLDVLEDSDSIHDKDQTHAENIRYSSSSGATILIVEDSAPNYIIGSSTGSSAARKVRVDDDTIDCDDLDVFKGEVECKTVRSTTEDYAKNAKKNPKDGIMALAFRAQKEAGFPKTLVVSSSQPDADDDKDYFVSQSLIYEQSEGENLRWRIIVAMPVPPAANDELRWGDPMTVVVCSVGVIGCISCLGLLYLYFSKRGNRQIAMSDWRFTSAFILGCAMLNLTTLTTVGPTTDTTCMLRMWSFHLVFVLALTPLLVKVWRIYRLVGSADRAIRLSISNKKAMCYTLPAILLQVAILTIFSIFDPSSKHTYVDIDGSSSFHHIVCKHDTKAFTITQILFEGGFILVGCVLAFKTRNLGEGLGEAKQLLFAMYNVALVALIVILLGACLDIDQKSVYVIMTVGIFWATVFSSCAFVLPRLVQVQRYSTMGRRLSSFNMGQFNSQRNNSSAELRGSRCSFSVKGNPSPSEIVDSMFLSSSSTCQDRRNTFNESSLVSNAHQEDQSNGCSDTDMIESGDGLSMKKRNSSFSRQSISASEALEIANEISSSNDDDVEEQIVFSRTDQTSQASV